MTYLTVITVKYFINYTINLSSNFYRLNSTQIDNTNFRLSASDNKIAFKLVIVLHARVPK